MQSATLGVWLPFLCPNDLLDRWASPVDQFSGKDLLLLLCLDLFIQLPDSDDPRTETYLKIKSVVVSAEIDGALSIEFLQALVLILFYEYAHGIYPAASFTLGTCIQLMTFLEMIKLEPEDLGTDWLETEIQRRIWWAVYLLER